MLAKATIAATHAAMAAQISMSMTKSLHKEKLPPSGNWMAAKERKFNK